MPGKTTAEVEQAIYAEIEKLKNDPVTDEELQKAKNQIESSFIMARTRSSIRQCSWPVRERRGVEIAGEIHRPYPRGEQGRCDAGAREYFTEKNRQWGFWCR